MTILKQICLIFYFVTGHFIAVSLAQNTDSSIINALDSTIRPIKNLQADAGFSDISYLSDVLKDKSIIALGEATHGTSEFFSYKDRMIRFMISELKIKAIAFESDFFAVEYLDAYINHQIDTFKVAGGFPLIKETKSMLVWLRAYNAKQPPIDRVHLYGLEARGHYNVSKKILGTFNNLPPETIRLLEQLMATPYNQLDKNYLSKIEHIFPILYAEAEKKNDEGILLKHYAALLEQTLHLVSAKKTVNRDSYMASNAEWILKNTAHKKLIVWAHNGHISKSKWWDRKSMGTILYEHYKDSYYAIATDFSYGEVSVFVEHNKKHELKPVFYPEANAKNTYEYYFKQAKFDNFLLEVKYAPPVLRSLLEKRLNMRMIGGTPKPEFIKLSIADNFDLIAFISKSNPI